MAISSRVQVFPKTRVEVRKETRVVALRDLNSSKREEQGLICSFPVKIHRLFFPAAERAHAVPREISGSVIHQ